MNHQQSLWQLSEHLTHHANLLDARCSHLIAATEMAYELAKHDLEKHGRESAQYNHGLRVARRLAAQHSGASRAYAVACFYDGQAHGAAIDAELAAEPRAVPSPRVCGCGAPVETHYEDGEPMCFTCADLRAQAEERIR